MELVWLPESAGFWVIENVPAVPPSVPVRATAPEFDDTRNLMVPLPVPVAPLVTVIHESLLNAVQAHPALVTTCTEPVPPAAVMLSDVAESAYVQVGGFVLLTDAKMPWLGLKYEPLGLLCNATARTMYVELPAGGALSVKLVPVTNVPVRRVNGPAAESAR